MTHPFLKHLPSFAIGLAVIAAMPVRASAVEVLIPAYFSPAWTPNYWTQLNAAAGQVGLTAIVNPASGPSTSADPRYATAITNLRAAGGRVIGYVSTSYAQRPIADVETDIDRYRTFYGSLDGFFLDEMTNVNDATDLAYYGQLYTYIKSLDPNYRVTANPGSNVAQPYVSTPVADTVVTFENNTGYNSFNPSTYTSAYATRRFGNLPYQIATSAAMTTAVNRAVSKRVGYIYVTDDGADGNPWDRLPTYWADELTTIRSLTPTWKPATSGDWNAQTNWTTAAAPNGVGAEAMLMDAIGSAQTLYSNANITLGTLVFNNANRYVLAGVGSLTMDATVEGALIDVRRGQHTINLPLTLNDSTTAFVSSGASLTIADPVTIAAGASLNKAGPGTLTLTSTVTSADGSPVALAVSGGSVALAAPTRLASLAMAGEATLELGTGGVVLSQASAAQLNALVADDHLTSDATDDQHALGVASADRGTTFRGLRASSGDVIVGYTLRGDTNLDGVVGFDDLLALARGAAGGTDVLWSTGDVNYDGVIDTADVALFRENYTSNGFAADWQLARALVPEPMLATVGLASVGLIRLRRRAR